MDEEYIGERTDAQGGRGARAAPSRQGQQVARQGTSGRPPGGRGAERMDGPGWQGRAGLCHDEGSPGRRRSVRRGQRAARRGTSGRPRGQASGAGVGRVRVRADVDERRRARGNGGQPGTALEQWTPHQRQRRRQHRHVVTQVRRSSIADDWKHTISYLFIIPFTISYRASVADKEQTKSSRQRVAAPRAAILPMYLTSYGASRLSVIGRWRAA